MASNNHAYSNCKTFKWLDNHTVCSLSMVMQVARMRTCSFSLLLRPTCIRTTAPIQKMRAFGFRETVHFLIDRNISIFVKVLSMGSYRATYTLGRFNLDYTLNMPDTKLIVQTILFKKTRQKSQQRVHPLGMATRRGTQLIVSEYGILINLFSLDLFFSISTETSPYYKWKNWGIKASWISRDLIEYSVRYQAVLGRSASKVN